MFNSLNKKIVAYMIMLTLLCTVSLTIVSFIMVEKSMMVQMKQDGSTLITVLTKNVEGYGSTELDKIKDLFREISDKNMKSLEYISISDNNYNIIVNDIKVIGMNQNVDGVSSATQEENDKELKDNENIVGTVFEKDGKKVYNLSTPITLLDGFSGKINIGISLEAMYHQLYDTIRNIVIISVFIQIITIVIALFIGKSLTKPLVKIVSTLKRVEKNDLTVEVNIKSNDEIEKVSNAINSTVKNLKGTIMTIRETTHTLSNSSEVLAKSTMDSSSYSEEIAASVQEVNAVIENQNGNILSIVDRFDEFSVKLDTMINETTKIINGNESIYNKTIDGYDQLRLLIDSIVGVRDLFVSSKDKIIELNNSVEKIDQITNVINSVAEQTNLLSLNAAIEAARVGTLGTGFGVVAEEIRALSNQVRESSDNINKILRIISFNSKSILEQSDVISSKIENQMTTINETVDSCESIKNEVEKNTIYTNIVSSSLQLIKEDKDIIIEAVNEVSGISSEITASTEEVAATLMNQTESSQKISELGETLNGVAEDLKNMIEKFIV